MFAAVLASQCSICQSFCCGVGESTNETDSLSVALPAKYLEQGLCNGMLSVCLYVCPICLLQQHAEGLLLWALRAGNINRLLPGMSAAGVAAFRSISTAANMGGVMFTAT